MKMNAIIIDLDATLTIESDLPYEQKEINRDVLKACVSYKEQGFRIIISTSRSMRTYEGNLGKINKNTLPKILSWLNENNVPFDEIYVGKPWCGKDGFYVDDRAIRPSEFSSLNENEIKKILDIEKKTNRSITK